MNFPRLRFLLAILLAAILLAACSSAGSTPTPPTQAPPDLNLDGPWSGMTDQNQGISFIIQDKHLTSLSLGYSMENCSEKTFSMNAQKGVGVWKDHALTLKLPQELAITFLNDTQGSGTFVFDPSLGGILQATCKPGAVTTIKFNVNKLQR